MQFIDLTHEIYDEMPAFTGEDNLSLKQFRSIENDSYRNYELKCNLHTGTHLDSTAHFLENGEFINKIPLDKLCGKGFLIDARNSQTEINTDLNNVEENSIVVICTGYYKNFRKDNYFENYPVISESFCRQLIAKKIKMLCLDTPSPDKFPYEIHPKLFNSGILIAENLNNTEMLLNIESFEIFAFPLNIQADGSLLRIAALIR